MKKTILFICFFAVSLLSRAQAGSDKELEVIIGGPDAPITLSPFAPNHPSAFGSTDGSLTVAIDGGTSGSTANPADETYTVEWRIGNASGAEIPQTEISNIVIDGSNPKYNTTLNNRGAGTYYLRVTDRNGCSTEGVTYTLTQPQLLTVSITLENAITCNGDTGSLTANPNGGILPYKYKWYKVDNGINTLIIPLQTNQNISGLSAGEFVVEVIDNNGNGNSKFSDTFPLSEPDLLKFIFTQTNVSCFGGNDGAIDVTVTGGTLPYTFKWLGEDSVLSEDRTNLTASTYYLKVIDGSLCETDGYIEISISQPTTAISITSGIGDIQNPTSANGNDGSISITINGGTLNGLDEYTIQWTKDGGNYSTQEDLINLESGQYVVTVTDSNGCIATETYPITDPVPLTVAITEQEITCSGASDGALTANGDGGVPIPSINYTYEWHKQDANGIDYTSIGQSTITAVGLDIGTYKVIVTDNNGIKAEDIITISQPAALTLSFTKQDIFCKYGINGSIDIEVLGGTTAYIFSWTDSSGNEIATTEDVNNLMADTYHVQVTDGRNCVLEQDIEIIEPINNLEIVIDSTLYPSAFQSLDGAINVTVSGGTAPYTYQWTDASNTPIGSLEDISGLGAGTYTLSVTDSNFNSTTENNGCTINETFPLSEPDALVVSITPNSTILCYGNTIGMLTANGSGGIEIPNVGYTYEWFKEDENGSLIPLNITTETINGLGAGIYSVTITDANAATASSLNFTLDEPSLLEASFSSTEINCSVGNDGTATVNITGGIAPYDIEWSNGDTSTTIDNLIAGTYIVYIIDANGCQVTGQVSVEQPGDLVISVTEQNNPTCHMESDGSITVNVTGGQTPYTYLWNTGDTTTSISNLTEGTYVLQVTDATNNNCTAFLSVILTDPAPIMVDLGADRTLCNAQAHHVDITIDDAGATYQWTSNNGFTSNSSTVSLTEAGIYNATLTTGAGCMDADTIEITTSTTAIDSQFLITSQAFAKEEIILVNTSNPLSPVAEWILPTEAKIIEETKETITLRFDLPGAYEITLRALEGDCSQSYTKPIIVEEARDLPDIGDADTPFILGFITYPNPTTGVFQVEITLQEEATISLRMYSLISNVPIDDRQAHNANKYILDYNVNLPSGIYFLLLETAKGNVIRKIVIE